MFSAAIVGARGYLGRELVRLLSGHPEVGRLVPVSLSGAEGALGDSVPAFRHRSDLALVGPDHADVKAADVLFLATAAGEAKAFVADLPNADALVVDLSRDHRLQALAHAAPLALAVAGGGSMGASENGWVYGLPDSALAPRRGDRRIANPGCYPTAALLSILPALRAGLVAPGPVIVDGKSGVSGAGATPRADLHYPETNENVRAYKVLDHDHGHEIQAALGAATTNRAIPPKVRFTPHLVPMNRGLLTTVYMPLGGGVPADEVRQAYQEAYATTPSVHLVEEPATVNVARTNRAEVAVDVDPDAAIIVARSAIDNLVKGGAGQAVHNMNIALGIEPTLGLPLLGGGP